MARPTHLEIIPMGGLGEFGMNLMVYRYGEDCLVVDAGMMFPGAEHLGVDVVIPDLTFLESCGKIQAVILTHGHEDHIGALPFLLQRHDVPIRSTPFTLGLIGRRLKEHEFDDRPGFEPLPLNGESLRFGPFSIEALQVAHSIPQAVMLVVRTPAGTVVHTADFKLDPMPLDGVGTDITAKLERVGNEGVLALLSDSTNAERPGFTPSERSVAPVIGDLLRKAEQRVFVTTFASNIYRMQQVVDLAAENGRKVALVGSSMLSHADVAERFGLLHFPPGVRVEAETAMDMAPRKVLFLATGSQGEPMSALSRIAVGRHRDVSLEEGDLVIHSARIIPGNEKSIGRMINHLLRQGAEVVTQTEAPVHVSGHPAQEELRLVLNLVRPRFLLPIHGEYRQLRSHADLGRAAGLEEEQLIMAFSGDVVALGERGGQVVDRIHVGQVFIDASLEEVDLEVLRDRKKIAGDGIVVPVVALDRENGSDTLEIVSRGFLSDESENGLMEEVRELTARILSEASHEERTDEGLLKAKIQTEIKRFLRRRAQRRPLIIPVILEL